MDISGRDLFNVKSLNFDRLCCRVTACNPDLTGSLSTACMTSIPQDRYGLRGLLFPGPRRSWIMKKGIVQRHQKRMVLLSPLPNCRSIVIGMYTWFLCHSEITLIPPTWEIFCAKWRRNEKDRIHSKVGGICIGLLQQSPSAESIEKCKR